MRKKEKKEKERERERDVFVPFYFFILKAASRKKKRLIVDVALLVKTVPSGVGEGFVDDARLYEGEDSVGDMVIVCIPAYTDVEMVGGGGIVIMSSMPRLLQAMDERYGMFDEGKVKVGDADTEGGERVFGGDARQGESAGRKGPEDDRMEE